MEIGTVKPIKIDEEMKGAYLDYAMSVITARALPDVRDGLKPVQRRILFAMDELSLRPTGPHKKSARIVGEVLGKYHPHGDSPVYEAMVRMAQDFSLRYPLVDGQGNFGSVDGDPPAAMRYTEARLARIAEEMLADIDKNTVDFVPNFDGSLKEPAVLPAKLPNLLLNGSAGIAVGMATNVPPHNLSEIVDAIGLIIARLADILEGGVPFAILWSRVQGIRPDAEQLAAAFKGLSKPLAVRVDEEAHQLATKPTVENKIEALLNIVDDTIAIDPDDLMAIVKGPDFPTAGIIIGEEGIKSAYATGHGRITIRAKVHTEDIRGGKTQIIITELPFQVNKATLIEKIAELVRDRRVEGISELRDESDRQGMRVLIELKRDTPVKQVLNQLYKYTSMQTTFSINMLALVDGQPRVLTLKMLLLQYIKYRREVLIRRTEFELAKARHRAHILEGLKIALDNLDEVITTIRRSANAEAAKTTLMKRFKLSELQAQAILDMQLRRLAALERQKILDELAEVLKLIAQLEDLLAQPAKILYVIRDELNELKEKYGDARRTRIVAEEMADFTEEDLIPDQEVTIALTAKNYVKRLAGDAYRVRRGAKSANGAGTKEDDPVQQVLTTNMLDTLTLFTNRGRVLQMRVREIPDTTRQARGLHISNFVQLDEGEKLASIIPTRTLGAKDYFVLVTTGGEIKRVTASDFSAVRSSGMIAINLPGTDELSTVKLATGPAEIVIVTAQGRAIRFTADDVRPTGRTSGGVRAIKLSDNDRVVGVALAAPGVDLAVVLQSGLAKRTSLDEYPIQGRAGGGVKAATTTAKTGPIVGAFVVRPGDNLVITASDSTVYRIPIDDVAAMSRGAQGTLLPGLEKGTSITAVSHIEGRSSSDSDQGTPNGSPDNGQLSPSDGPANGRGKVAKKTPPAGPTVAQKSKVETASNADEKQAAVKEAERIMGQPNSNPGPATSRRLIIQPASSDRAEEARPGAEGIVKTTPTKKKTANTKTSSTTKVTPATASRTKASAKTQTEVSAKPASQKTAAASPPPTKSAPAPMATAKTTKATVAKVASPKVEVSKASVTAAKSGRGATPGTAEAVQVPLQGWISLDEEGKGSPTAGSCGRATKTPAKRAPAGPSKNSPMAKSEGKSPSLIGSIAAKIAGNKSQRGQRGPGR